MYFDKCIVNGVKLHICGWEESKRGCCKRNYGSLMTCFLRTTQKSKNLPEYQAGFISNEFGLTYEWQNQEHVLRSRPLVLHLYCYSFILACLREQLFSHPICTTPASNSLPQSLVPSLFWTAFLKSHLVCPNWMLGELAWTHQRLPTAKERLTVEWV